MKNPFDSLKGRLSELKGRTLLIVIVAAVVIVMLIVFIFGGNSGTNTVAGPGSSTVKAPRLESTPGVSKVNDQSYVELQQQANMQKAQQAIGAGKSAVATVTSDQYVNELSIPEPGIASINGRNNPAALAQQQKQQNESLAQYQKLHQEQLSREQAREQERIQEETAKQQEAYQDAFESLMQNQAKGLLGQWQAPSQSYVQGSGADNKGESGAGSARGSQFTPMYKAGDIIFGVMETSVDSDEPGPVLARVVSGPLSGAKLIGSFRRVDDQVFLEFSLLNAPDVAMSVPVKAVAIDPETARTALATDVDYHRLLRYGTLFASAFLQGVGEAVLAGIQPDFTVDGSTFSVTNVESTTKDQILVGVGEVGTKLGDKLDPIFNTPPTVTLDSGTAIGLLFLQDFSLEAGANNTQSVPGAMATRPLQIIDETGSYSLAGVAPAALGGAAPMSANTLNTGSTNPSTTNSTVKSQ